MPSTPPPHPPVTRLPGLGERLDLVDAAGRPFALVRRHDGTVELHPPAASVPGLPSATAVVPGAASGSAAAGPLVLPPATARAAGAFVSGHYAASPQLLERVGDVLGGLVLDAERVAPGSPADGRTIEELQIRRRTGVTIVAVLRGAQPLVDPDPSTRLHAGDELVVMASDDALERFRRLVGAVR